MVVPEAKFLYMCFIAAIVSSAFVSTVSRLQAQCRSSYWLTAEDEGIQPVTQRHTQKGIISYVIVTSSKLVAEYCSILYL